MTVVIFMPASIQNLFSIVNLLEIISACLTIAMFVAAGWYFVYILRARLLSEIVFIPNFTCLTQLHRQLSQRNETLHINFTQSPPFNMTCKILTKQWWTCLKIYHHKVYKSLTYVKRRDVYSSITCLRVNHCVTAGCKNQRKC